MGNYLEELNITRWLSLIVPVHRPHGNVVGLERIQTSEKKQTRIHINQLLQVSFHLFLKHIFLKPLIILFINLFVSNKFVVERFVRLYYAIFKGEYIKRNAVNFNQRLCKNKM